MSYLYKLLASPLTLPLKYPFADIHISFRYVWTTQSLQKSWDVKWRRDEIRTWRGEASTQGEGRYEL